MVAKVSDPVYKIYDRQGERGYLVEFSLKENTAEPLAVIINGLKQNILPLNKTGNHFKINIIAHSQLLQDIKTEVSDKENGIIFRTEKGEVFQKVTFRLIK